MDALPVPIPPVVCHADHCRRPPRFQVCLDAVAASRPVRANVEACALHLGDVVQALVAWARNRNVHEGQLTVLTVDPPVRPDPGWANVSTLGRGCFAFTTIRLTP